MVDKSTDAYLFQKRGIWYFSRHVPVDIRGHYPCKRLVRSLRTKSHSKASKTALVWSDHLESVWSGIRLRHLGLGPSFEEVTLSSSNAPTLTDALDTYLKLKGHGRASHYEAAARRAIGYAVEAIGDKPIDAYSQLDASRFRDALFARELSSSSVKRMFSAVKAIMQLSIAEYGLPCPNVFRGTFLPKKDDVRKRQPIPIDTIRSVQNECQTMDDDLRWLIAFLSDSGLRLAEAVGLLITDIRMDTDIPHVVIQQHDWRPLKTASSTRTVPLVGLSLEFDWKRELVDPVVRTAGQVLNGQNYKTISLSSKPFLNRDTFMSARTLFSNWRRSHQLKTEADWNDWIEFRKRDDLAIASGHRGRGTLLQQAIREYLRRYANAENGYVGGRYKYLAQELTNAGYQITETDLKNAKRTKASPIDWPSEGDADIQAFIRIFDMVAKVNGVKAPV